MLRGPGASAPAPVSAPAGLPAPAHRALAEDAALDLFVQSLAHDQALNLGEPSSALAPSTAVAAAAAPGAHRRLLSARAPATLTLAKAISAHVLVPAAKAPAMAPAKVVLAALLASAAKAPAAAPALPGAAKLATAKPLASAFAPATAPYGEAAPAAKPARRALSEASPRSPDNAVGAPAKHINAALAMSGQTAPAPPNLED